MVIAMSDPSPPSSEPPEASPPPAYPAPGGYYAPPAPYGWPQGAPPAGYGPPPGAYGAPYAQGPGWYAGGYGMSGQLRPTAITILLFVCTLGIYGYVYNFKVHDEMKRHSGRGIGGGVALLLTFLANVAMPFVTAAEVGSLYERRGERPPVNGWTGLWAVVPAVLGYFLIIISVLATASVSTTNSNGNSSMSDGSIVTVVLVIVVFAVLVVGGPVMWFVKTNGALNRYWESVGVS
jgi:Domain of unknown function (DUF4234)